MKEAGGGLYVHAPSCPFPAGDYCDCQVYSVAEPEPDVAICPHDDLTLIPDHLSGDVGCGQCNRCGAVVLLGAR